MTHTGRACECAIGRWVDLGEQIWPLAPLREIVAGLVDDLDTATLDHVIGRARRATPSGSYALPSL